MTTNLLQETINRYKIDDVERDIRAFDIISSVQKSNLYTMGIASRTDKRQSIPEKYEMPPVQVRLLRAKLILEEALETVEALGFSVHTVDYDGPVDSINALHLYDNKEPNLDEIIDGCCDLWYVACGTLVSVGAPDIPHLDEVCKCNNAKFQGGVSKINESGKFLKPEGWVGPNHRKIEQDVALAKEVTKLLAKDLLKDNKENTQLQKICSEVEEISNLKYRSELIIKEVCEESSNDPKTPQAEDSTNKS